MESELKISESRTFTACDFCSSQIKGTPDNMGIKAILNEPFKHKGGTKQEVQTKEFHLCHETCLRNLLNKRAEAKKKMRKTIKGMTEINLFGSE